MPAEVLTFVCNPAKPAKRGIYSHAGIGLGEMDFGLRVQGGMAQAADMSIANSTNVIHELGNYTESTFGWRAKEIDPTQYSLGGDWLLALC